MPLLEFTPTLPVAAALGGAEPVSVIQDGLPVQSTVQDIADLGAQASDATPLVESGAGSAGTSADFSRADHVHPAAAAANSIIAGVTVAANATTANAKNITSVTRTAPNSGEYTIVLTANTATKYAPQATLAEGVFKSSIRAAKTNATTWVVTTKDDAGAADLAFSFILFSLD